jgi:transcriptional regulator with XRE-family HTH domain
MPAIDRQALAGKAAALELAAPQLAEAAGCSTSHVINILAGRRLPSIDTIHRLARAVGCTFADLYDPCADPPRSPLRARRIAAGVEAQALAARLGISPRHLWNIEGGHRGLSARVARAAARELGCEPSDLTDADVAA